MATLRVLIARGCLIAVGSSVDGSAAALSINVPQHAREKRLNRDGPGHHVTIVAKHELSTLTSCTHAMLMERASELVTIPHALGVGSATRAKAQCWFVVCMWPHAQQLRSSIGLPPIDLHITLGFTPADVHGVSKGVGTLLSPSSPRDWPAVVQAAQQTAAVSAMDAKAYEAALVMLDWLIEKASLCATDAVCSDIRCSRCELLMRRGDSVDIWGSDAEAAVSLDGNSGRALLMLSRACCAQRRWGQAHEAAMSSADHSQRVGDLDTAHAANKLRERIEKRPRRDCCQHVRNLNHAVFAQS